MVISMTILMEIQMIKGGLQTDHLVFEERKKLFRGNSFLNIAVASFCEAFSIIT
jgi:hypothetical protein